MINNEFSHCVYCDKLIGFTQWNADHKNAQCNPEKAAYEFNRLCVHWLKKLPDPCSVAQPGERLPVKQNVARSIRAAAAN